MNYSEQLFEKILTNHRIGFRKIPESTIRTPDYEILLGSMKTFWEIKEIEENKQEKQMVQSTKSGQVEVYSVDSNRVVNSIKSASKQFKSYQVTDKPCIVVLADRRDFFVRDLLFIQTVQSKMIGVGHYMQNDSGQYFEFLREPGLLTKGKKYISAIAIMFAATEDIVFLHNPYANISLLDGPVTAIFRNHFIATKGQHGLEWRKL